MGIASAVLLALLEPAFSSVEAEREREEVWKRVYIFGFSDSGPENGFMLIYKLLGRKAPAQQALLVPALRLLQLLWTTVSKREKTQLKPERERECVDGVGALSGQTTSFGHAISQTLPFATSTSTGLSLPPPPPDLWFWIWFLPIRACSSLVYSFQSHFSFSNHINLASNSVWIDVRVTELLIKLVSTGSRFFPSSISYLSLLGR